MSVATIHAVLRRRAMADDRLGLGGGGGDDDDAYWASPPRLYDFSKHQLKDEPPQEQPLLPPLPPAPSPPSPKPAPSPPSPPSPKPAPVAPPAPAPLPPSPKSVPVAPPAPSPPSPPSPTPGDAHLCLLALQGAGVSWGVRKRVRYVHRAARPANHGRRVGPVAFPGPAQAAVAQADEESSSNVKPTDQPDPERRPDAEAEPEGGDQEAAAPVAEKKRKRRRKSRGFTLGRTRKRARREMKPPAPKAEAVAVVPRAVPHRSVAKVYAATEADAAEESKPEVERKVARGGTEGKAKRKEGGATRGAVAKRPRKAMPKEEEAEEESGRDERKAAVVVKTERRKSRREERAEGDRKAVVVKTERKKSRREEEAEKRGREERKGKAVVVVKTERKKSRREYDDEEEEEESAEVERKAVVVKTERKSTRRKEKTELETKPASPDNKLVKVDEPGGTGRAMVDRWTAQRYRTAEAALLATVRSLGARAGKPVQRRQLREEARKRIGDTGLLDHLLKHTKDKVAPGGAERLRRRHNADGAMEYWLEPAELAALRREAGVADPYWVPPPGWKLGDPVSPDACALVMKRQVQELAAELAGVKRHMEQLMKAHPGTLSNEVKSEAAKAYISHEPYQEKYGSMVKANSNLEKQVLSLEEKYASAARANDKLEQEVLFLKEKYEAVVEKNNRLEEEMADLSTTFLALKDDLLLLDDGEHEQHLRLMEAEESEHLYLCAKESPEAEKQESNGHESPGDAAAAAPALAAVGAGDQPADFAGDGTTSSSGGGGRRTSRKCSVRICKPQGAFQWPDAAPAIPTVVMDDDDVEHVMAAGDVELPPTPTSASSTNAASSAKLLLLPAPESPVQQPPPPAWATCSSPRHGGLQEAAQPDADPELQLRHAAQDASPSLPLPCGANAGLPEVTKTAALRVGTELALATPSY